ncbi:flagellar basal-body MS-ring/collar protein FliF [Ideonella livida]|uniref:Flagellar M-ring protein n=1 Tax=Ideonella livida TaxID=2707176 RepID=A0A7C9PIV6_9BURK|nr:flagellar basal-body MS-ring/collar protein FliF [Ideonella livida]NDY92331.1 flagellar basal body M-ring protein FliF [Ideonella livida]
MDAEALPVPAAAPELPPAAAATPEPPRTAMDKLRALPPAAKIKLGVGVALLLALLVGVLLWSNRSEWKVLYANLNEKDQAAVIAQLTQQNVPYKYTDGGGAILVPAERVYDLKMKLAAAGLPKAGLPGNEILDNARFGQTDRQERSNLQRALEGELVRTIMRLDGIEEARVHLALPVQNGFFREQQKPSASVMVTMLPGRTLDRGQTAAIVHLVSSSVSELNPKAVSVLDHHGNLLSGPGEDQAKSLDEQQLKYVREIEAEYLKRVQAILEPVLGKDNVRATVTAEIDFSQSEATSEAYKPNQGENTTSAVRSQQILESAGPGQQLPTGVPGAATNQPPVPATAPVNGAAPPLTASTTTTVGGGSKRENVTNFELDRTVRVVRNATGQIRRITAAAVVNHRLVTDPKGKAGAQPQPLPQEELDKLTALVQEAVGYSRDRGDSVRVVNVPFRADKGEPEPELPLWKQAWFLEMLKAGALPAAVLLGALVLMFGVIRPTLKEAFAPPPPPPPPEEEEKATQLLDAVVDEGAALPGAEGGAPALEGMPSGLPALEAPQENTLLEQARRLARENPVAVANIMRDWVNGEAG